MGAGPRAPVRDRPRPPAVRNSARGSPPGPAAAAEPRTSRVRISCWVRSLDAAHFVRSPRRLESEMSMRSCSSPHCCSVLRTAGKPRAAALARDPAPLPAATSPPLRSFLSSMPAARRAAALSIPRHQGGRGGEATAGGAGGREGGQPAVRPAPPLLPSPGNYRALTCTAERHRGRGRTAQAAVAPPRCLSLSLSLRLPSAPASASLSASAPGLAPPSALLSPSAPASVALLPPQRLPAPASAFHRPLGPPQPSRRYVGTCGSPERSPPRRSTEGRGSGAVLGLANGPAL